MDSETKDEEKEKKKKNDEMKRDLRSEADKNMERRCLVERDEGEMKDVRRAIGKDQERQTHRAQTEAMWEY